MIERGFIWKTFLFLLMAGAGLVSVSCSSDEEVAQEEVETSDPQNPSSGDPRGTPVFRKILS